MHKTTVAHHYPIPSRQHIAAVLLVVGLSYVASRLALKGGGAITTMLLAVLACAAYAVLTARWPEVSFPIFLLASTEVLGLVPYERWPLIRFSFGSISLLDVLVLYPFFQVQYEILSGRVERRQTVFHNPLIYLFVILAIAVMNSIFLKNQPYREVIRGGRPYLYYLYYFILIYSVRSRESFFRLIAATTTVVLLGCLVQIGQYILGPSQEELIQMLRGLIQSHAYIDIKTLMVINVAGRDVVRFLMRTGNFAVLLFFICLFALVREVHSKQRVFLVFLLMVSGISIFLTYGRTLFLMMTAGLVAGVFLEVDQRRRYVTIVLIGLGSIILSVLLLSIASAGGENILLAIWDRFTGIVSDIKYSRGTFGSRVQSVQELLPLAIRNMPLGAGLGSGGVWDVGILCFLLHFGIFAPLFYVWILKNSITRFLYLYRLPLSPRSRPFVKGFACFLVAQLTVILIQDPFPIPVGILLVVFVLAGMEFLARFGLGEEDAQTPPPPVPATLSGASVHR